MEKTTERERKLPAHQVNLADLKGIIDRVAMLFGDKKLYISINFKINNIDYKFTSIEEIETIPELPDKILSYLIWISDFNRTISISSGALASLFPCIRAKGESEAWCAGAIETVLPTFTQGKLWYSWFRGWPIGAGLLLSLNLWILPQSVRKIFGVVGIRSVVFMAVPVIVFTLLYIFRGRLLPASIVEIRKSESSLEKNYQKWTLGIAILSLVVAAIGLFIRK
jgi:hypothetical protein